ncbi:NAD(P)-binding domain-containing protein [Mycolicibacterium sp. 3033]|nr:NAD(P)-binding domain-containing protein [Mycolicibacterium aurantiacum]
MSSISIIGLGRMATALARRALAGGNTVEILGRDPEKAKEFAKTLDGATVGTFGGAPEGDLVVLAVPYAGAAEAVGAFGDALHGKILLDITNTFTPDLSGLVIPDGSSGAEETAKAAPAGTRVVKGFNTVFAEILATPPDASQPLNVFLAGDDAEAKAVVSAFADSMGFRPLDAGPLSMARALEYAGLLELNLKIRGLEQTDFVLGITVVN